MEHEAKKNVVDSAFNEMLAHIVSGQWAIGQKIPSENELSEQLQVSRNSVRQALNRFNALGIIESRHGDGSYVHSVDLSFYLNVIFPMVVLSQYDALNVYQLQRAIQNEAAHTVCALATEEQIASMRGQMQEMHRCADGCDRDGFLKADMAFHQIFADMTRNPVLISIEACLNSIMTGPLRNVVVNNQPNDSLVAHENILRALECRDHYAVTTWMAAHMADVIHKLDTLSKNTDVTPNQE